MLKDAKSFMDIKSGHSVSLATISNALYIEHLSRVFFPEQLRTQLCQNNTQNVEAMWRVKNIFGKYRIIIRETSTINFMSTMKKE